MNLFADEPRFVFACDATTAAYWCKKYHYSESCPSVQNAYECVENGQAVGVVCFGIGATNGYASSIGLDGMNVCELVRVAMRNHATPVSWFVRAALRELKRNTDCVAVVSFADTKQGHWGGIYSAGGWLFGGIKTQQYLEVFGELTHPKTLHSRYGIGGQSIPWLRENIDPNARRVDMPPKIKYVYPLYRWTARKVIRHIAPEVLKVTRPMSNREMAVQLRPGRFLIQQQLESTQ